MIRSIQIEDDVYQYLLSKVTRFGESESDVLRRELGLALTEPPVPGTKIPAVHELSAALGSTEFRRARGVVGRFLEVLSAAYREKASAFDIVLSIQGRGRTYFAKSEAEITASGSSTQPKQIPGSPYWVMTNSPTPQKQEMLREVLGALGYSREAINAAVSAIAA